MDYQRLIMELVNKTTKKSDREEISTYYLDKFSDLTDLGVKPEDAWMIVERDIQELTRKQKNFKKEMLYGYFWPLVIAIYFIYAFVWHYFTGEYIYGQATLIFFAAGFIYLVILQIRWIYFLLYLGSLITSGVLFYQLGILYVLLFVHLLLFLLLAYHRQLKFDTLFWPTLSLLYFTISYVFNLWSISWVVFLVAPFIYALINYRINR